MRHWLFWAAFLLPLSWACAFEPMPEGENITALRAELCVAEERLEEARELVREARYALHAAQIDLVSRRLDQFDDWLGGVQPHSQEYTYFLREQLPQLFTQERAQLTAIIADQGPLSERAQELLDRLLARITALNNQLRVQKKCGIPRCPARRPRT